MVLVLTLNFNFFFLSNERVEKKAIIHKKMDNKQRVEEKVIY